MRERAAHSSQVFCLGRLLAQLFRGWRTTRTSARTGRRRRSQRLSGPSLRFRRIRPERSCQSSWTSARGSAALSPCRGCGSWRGLQLYRTQTGFHAIDIWGLCLCRRAPAGNADLGNRVLPTLAEGPVGALPCCGGAWRFVDRTPATNTSGFLKHLQKAMELVYTWVSQEARRAHADMAQGEERPPKSQPPAKRKGTAGGGSLAAAGQTAAQPQNRGSFTAIEPELLGVLAWLLNESAVDSAVPGKLWWDRPVMQSNKQFQVVDPFFSFVAAGHLHELPEKLMRDSLGLRQRLRNRVSRYLTRGKGAPDVREEGGT